MKKTQIKWNTEEVKSVIIFAFLFMACFLMYYFYIILQITIIFTHFFYVPIILACFWWKYKGLIVPLFLSLILIFTPIFLGFNKITVLENIFRAYIFTSIGILIAFFSKRISEADYEIKQAFYDLDQIFNVSIPMYVMDKEYNMIKINDRFCSLFRLQKKEIIGKKCYDVWKEKYCDMPECSLRQILEEKDQYEYEVEKELSDGTKLYCIVNSIPYRKSEGGEIVGAIKVIIDITERKIAEKKLETLEKMYEKAYQMAELYKDLFAHDINNILHNIQLATELISQWKNKSNNEDKTSKYITIVKEQIMRGSRLVSNVRTLSKIEETSTVLQKIDAILVVKDAINYIYKSYPENHLNLQFDFQSNEIFIQANKYLLDVFENILINAIGYNENLIIEISVKVSKTVKEGKNFARIEFIDNGIGILKERKMRIFDGVSECERTMKGMGIGLSLVKKIITSYGGTIWVEDKIQGDPSKGSNFILLIPEAI